MNKKNYMKFYYSVEDEICEGNPYIDDDSSVLFEYSKIDNIDLDFTIALGGNPRCLLDISRKTGRCGALRCFLEGWRGIKKDLNISWSQKGGLYFKTDEEMNKYSGTMYFPFESSYYYDRQKNTICFGNPYLKRSVIEFVSNTYAVVKDEQLIAV